MQFCVATDVYFSCSIITNCICAWHLYPGSRYVLDHTLTYILDRLFYKTEKGSRHVTDLSIPYDIKQTWPKCGPSIYFCVPPTFFSFIKIEIKVNIWRHKQLKWQNVEKKVKKNSTCEPQWKITFKFGPRAKKSLATPDTKSTNPVGLDWENIVSSPYSRGLHWGHLALSKVIK